MTIEEIKDHQYRIYKSRGRIVQLQVPLMNGTLADQSTGHKAARRYQGLVTPDKKNINIAFLSRGHSPELQLALS